VLSAMLLFLATGSGLARGRQVTEPPGMVGTSASSAANAPWFKAEIDTPGDTGQYTSVVYDPFFGSTYVSYYDATNHDLRIARDDRAISNCGPGETWFCKALDDTAADVGSHSSIAVRPAGNGMGIAYYDATNGNLKYLWFDNPHLWTHHIAKIDEALLTATTGQYTSLQYSSGDAPYIAYYFENPGGVDALMLAYPQPDAGNCGYGEYYAGDWQCDTIDVGAGVGKYASLALDTLDRQHIAYYDAANGDLWYASSASPLNCGPGNSWTCAPVSQTGDVGKYASMYLDGDDCFHIAYYDDTANTLMYATNASAGGPCVDPWSGQRAEIDDMPEDYHPVGISIAEDPAGYPVIAYQAWGGSLKVARPVPALGLPAGSGNCGPEIPFSTWRCETIDRQGQWITYRNGDFVSIAVSPSGLATIAYNGFITSSGGNLMVARQRLQVFLPLTMRNP